MPASETRGSVFAGLISGTSIDGVDAALVHFEDRGCRLLATHMHAYPKALREALLAAIQDPTSVGIEELATLDHVVGAAFSDATNALFALANVAPTDVAAVGSHGQTLRHSPSGQHPYTLQIGDPNLIAQRTGVTTVADFRRRDVAAGGEGAPLAPAFHAWLLADSDATRCVLNLGGIANLTVLSATGESVIGFDTGPANTLMDAWTREHRNRAYDKNGAWAKTGTVSGDLLKRLSADDYFARPAPKSTGFEYFNLAWLEQHLGTARLAAEDVQATLLELTVATVADALGKQAPDCTELVVCGGGAHNGVLMSRLTDAVSPVPVVTTSKHGVDPDWVEAAAFAWLARQTLHRLPGNLPSVTGAASAEILGGVYLCAS